MARTMTTMAVPDAADRRDWTRFVRVFLLTAILLVAGYLALAYAVDPYDSGRSGLFSAHGLRPQGPRTAAASRGRDQAFDGAVIGNSHIQMLEPARFTEATGLSFVQLSVPGTGAGEQMTVLDWFIDHHRAPGAVIVGADENWCGSDPALPAARPFPYWLFARETGSYLRGLLSMSVAEEVVGRLAWLAGPRPRARPDGWWNYEHEYLDVPGYFDSPSIIARREAPVSDDPEPGRGGPYPAAGRLAASLDRLPDATFVVLVFPPVYRAGLPRPGTRRAAADAACKAALVAAARRRPNAAIVDWRVDRAENRDPAQFFDQGHYREALARRLMQDIVAALDGMKGRAASGR